jgi:acetylglutamate kinase
LALESLGLTVVRFRNEEVLSNVSEVIDQIKAMTSDDKHAYHFSPLGGGATKLFVIKIGGNVIDDKENLLSFLKNFASLSSPLQGQGASLAILIHGGGKIATKIGDKLGIESKYINGRRITDDETIDVVTMVYGGLVNKKIVAQLQSLQCNAIGLTGADGNIIPAVKRPVKDIDFGWVGDIDSAKLNVDRLKILLDGGFVPVFAPLSHDEQGHMLNTNADTIASSLAVALSAFYEVRLIYCFEKKGILADVSDEGSVITLINKDTYQQLLNEQKLFAGIIPKIDNAFAAIDAGVKEVLVGDAKDLLQNTTDKTSGTLFVS